LRRRDGQDHLHFITFCWYRRLPIQRSVHFTNIFVQTLSDVREGDVFFLARYVAMREQIHFLFGEPVRETPPRFRFAANWQSPHLSNSRFATKLKSKGCHQIAGRVGCRRLSDAGGRLTGNLALLAREAH
jgi:RimJ/RimL family protein N-acetyltransferase